MTGKWYICPVNKGQGAKVRVLVGHEQFKIESFCAIQLHVFILMFSIGILINWLWNIFSFSNSCLTPSPTVSVRENSYTAENCSKPRVAKNSTAFCSTTSCCWPRCESVFVRNSLRVTDSRSRFILAFFFCFKGDQTSGLIQLWQSILLENTPAVSHV